VRYYSLWPCGRIGVPVASRVGREQLRVLKRIGVKEVPAPEPISGFQFDSVATQEGFMSATVRCTQREISSGDKAVEVTPRCFGFEALVRALRKKNQRLHCSPKYSCGSKPDKIYFVTDRSLEVVRLLSA
jgi:hypothetical protein